jgi:RHS repeat-associated protein
VELLLEYSAKEEYLDFLKSETYVVEVGTKQYEMSNHLGNVLAVVSDKKEFVSEWKAVVLSAQDYYPFGMSMPDRKYTGGGGYRYGFNGKEKDNETELNDFGARFYAANIGRWLSVDPLGYKYQNLTPYSAFMNTPLLFVDPDGKDNFIYIVFVKTASSKLTVQDKNNIVKAVQTIHQANGIHVGVKYIDSNVALDHTKLDPTDKIAYVGIPSEINALNIPNAEGNSLFLTDDSQHSGSSGVHSDDKKTHSVVINFNAFDAEGVDMNSPWESKTKLKAFDWFTGMDPNSEVEVEKRKKELRGYINTKKNVIDLAYTMGRTISHELGHTVLGSTHPDEGMYGLAGENSSEPNVMSSGSSGYKYPFPWEQNQRTLLFLPKHQSLLWIHYETKGSTGCGADFRWIPADKPKDNFTERIGN